MQLPDPNEEGEIIGEAVGVYAYVDYDNEPIYVGQTSSSFRDRVSRHLTGQRSDAVAKFILDPFEVAFISMWSVPAVKIAKIGTESEAPARPSVMKRMLDPYEYTVYKELEAAAKFSAVLNEQPIAPTQLVDLPKVVRARIIPDELWEDRRHADIRIARRASTISRLSQMISEREVSPGMRRTLLLQASRLEWLARERIVQLGMTSPTPDEIDDEVQDEET